MVWILNLFINKPIKFSNEEDFFIIHSILFSFTLLYTISSNISKKYDGNNNLDINNDEFNLILENIKNND